MSAATCKIAWPQTVTSSLVLIIKGLAKYWRRLINDLAKSLCVCTRGTKCLKSWNASIIMFYAMFQHWDICWMLRLMFKHLTSEKPTEQDKSKRHKCKWHMWFVNPVRWQTHLLWGLPSQEGNPLVWSLF